MLNFKHVDSKFKSSHKYKSSSIFLLLQTELFWIKIVKDIVFQNAQWSFSLLHFLTPHFNKFPLIFESLLILRNIYYSGKEAYKTG